MKLNPQTIMEEFKKGKKPEELLRGKDKICSKNTAFKYWKRYKLYKELCDKLWSVIIESL